MNFRFDSFTALAIACIFATLSCSSAAPAPATTTAPAGSAAAAKPAEPTRSSTAPTTAPAAPIAQAAKAPAYPEKGRAINMIVPYSPGGVDTSARIVAAALEKELGVPVQIVNKAGGSTQVGTTEVALAKPDGYTLLYTTFPTVILSYLDPERKAAYNRKSLDPVAMTTNDPFTFAVLPDSPIKTMKDLVDAAKANPSGVKMAAGVLMSGNHVAVMMLESIAGIKFASVFFDGGAASLTALMGGHVDAGSSVLSTMLPQATANQVRPIGVTDSKMSPFIAKTPTAEEQGYKIHVNNSHMVAAPAGTPKEVVDVLTKAIKKVLAAEDLKQKMSSVGLEVGYMDPTQLGAYWDQMELDIAPVIKTFRQQ